MLPWKTDAVRERGKSICDRTGVDLWSWQDGDGYHKIAQLYDEGYRIATEQTDALRAYLNK